jgi:hypothetical protein
VRGVGAEDLVLSGKSSQMETLGDGAEVMIMKLLMQWLMG